MNVKMAGARESGRCPATGGKTLKTRRGNERERSPEQRSRADELSPKAPRLRSQRTETLQPGLQERHEDGLKLERASAPARLQHAAREYGSLQDGTP